MREDDVSRRHFLLELARGLDERLTFDIAYRAADLGDDDVGARLVGNAAQTLLDGVRDMGDDLNRAAEEIAATFPGDQALIDGTLGEIGVAGQALVDEALVMPEIEIRLLAVVGDEHLAMLERAHRARIDIQVGIHLLHGHAIPARLEKVAERCGRDAFAERRDDAAGHEDVLCHGSLPIPSGLSCRRMCRRFRDRSSRACSEGAPSASACGGWSRVRSAHRA